MMLKGVSVARRRRAPHRPERASRGLTALMAAWLLAFTLSLDDVVVAAFLSGPGYTTLPLEVFSRVRLGLKPEINALATLFMVVVGVIVVAVNRMRIQAAKRVAG